MRGLPLSARRFGTSDGRRSWPTVFPAFVASKRLASTRILWRERTSSGTGSMPKHWNGGLFFLDGPVERTFRHISSVNCPSAVEQPLGKVMIAGWRSKAVAFVAFLALTTFGGLATASAQPGDIIALNKAFQDHYARGNYSAAQIDAQEL